MTRAQAQYVAALIMRRWLQKYGLAVNWNNSAVAVGTYSSTNTPNKTGSITGSPADAILIGYLIIDGTGTVNSATWAGAAMTRIGTGSTESTNVQVEAWYKLSPSLVAGSTLQFNTAANESGLILAEAYSGVGGIGDVGVGSIGTGSLAVDDSANTTVTAAGDWTAGAAAINGNRNLNFAWVAGSGAGQSTRQHLNNSTLVTGGSGDTSAPANPQTDKVTWTTTSSAAILAFAVQPVAAGAGWGPLLDLFRNRLVVQA